MPSACHWSAKQLVVPLNQVQAASLLVSWMLASLLQSQSPFCSLSSFKWLRRAPQCDKCTFYILLVAFLHSTFKLERKVIEFSVKNGQWGVELRGQKEEGWNSAALPIVITVLNLIQYHCLSTARSWSLPM